MSSVVDDEVDAITTFLLVLDQNVQLQLQE